MFFKNKLHFWGRLILNNRWKSLLVAGFVFFLCSWGLYSYYTQANSQTRYIVSSVERGTISTLVSGTGQVSALKQISLNAKTSGEVVYIGAQSGDYVQAGQILVQLDTRDAEMSLASAKLALSKAKELSSLESGGKLSQEGSGALSVVSDYFVDSAEVIENIRVLLNDYTVSTYKLNLNDTGKVYYNQAMNDYGKARESYDKLYSEYKNLGGSTSDQEVSDYLERLIVSANLLAKASKSSKIFVSYVYNNTESGDRSSDLSSNYGDTNDWLQTVNSGISSLVSGRNSLTSSGYEIKSLEIALKQKQYAYDNCFVRAPFAGLVQIDVSEGENVSGSIGTIVSNQKIAVVSLNEVDAVKVKVGQGANLSFDAVEDLELKGMVTKIDVVGTVSQGVVSYDAQISFVSDDKRIKSGMSVSADIVVDEKKDVMVVPGSAVKTLGNRSYVEVLPAGLNVISRRGVAYDGELEKKFVTIGASDEEQVEILSGLKVGDKIITQTIAGTTSSTKSNTNSLASLLRPGNTRNSSPANRPSSSSVSGRTMRNPAF